MLISAHVLNRSWQGVYKIYLADATLLVRRLLTCEAFQAAAQLAKMEQVPAVLAREVCTVVHAQNAAQKFKVNCQKSYHIRCTISSKISANAGICSTPDFAPGEACTPGWRLGDGTQVRSLPLQFLLCMQSHGFKKHLLGAFFQQPCTPWSFRVQH